MQRENGQFEATDILACMQEKLTVRSWLKAVFAKVKENTTNARDVFGRS